MGKRWGAVFVAVGLAVAGCGVAARPPGTSGKATAANSHPRRLRVVAFWASDASAGMAALYKYPRSVSVYAPFWYSVEAYGALKNRVDSAVLRQVRAHHIPITPLINDGTGTEAFLSNPITRVRAARAIADAVRTNGFQGVDIDFEPPKTRYRHALTGFIIDLRDFLPKRDRITLAIVPHSGGAYDYAKLAPEIDQFVLMSYDEHADGTQEGPVAGYPWVKAIVARILKYIPANKLDLGIPLYGYSWPDGSTHATTIPYNQVTPAMRAHARWSATYQETYARYTGPGGPVTVWWESLEGVNNKIQLAQADHLAGIALWHIGYADASVPQLLLHQIGRQ